jgi:hypothetical protein
MADFITLLVYGLGSEEVQQAPTIQYIDMFFPLILLLAVVGQTCFGQDFLLGVPP